MSKGVGLVHKYNVERVDGKPIADGCFVLEYKDKHAQVAIRAYAESAANDGYELLAQDLLKKVGPLHESTPTLNLNDASVYLSGKMTGLPDDGKALFNQEAARLRSLGFRVFNPAEQPDQASWEAYMKRDMAALVECDLVATLDNWHDSRGARLEVFLARELGIAVVSAKELR
ncbi:MAG: DUF4406 domain-containing protein [Candidatus Obscuribacterales bacterium]|nr:DUF4406 domain-containing protein [Candidatus Obscuribacterales bacterium]